MPARSAFVALLVLVCLPASVARGDNPRLQAIVGTNDAFVISLRDAAGNVVSHLDPGTYDIAVSDRSEIHNFHLSGPGVDQATRVDAKEEVTWTVALTDGRYTYVCDEHVSTMHGSFAVGNVPEPPAPRKLSGTVGPRRTISLRDAAGKLRTIQEGAVALTVADRTRVDNFHLFGPGVNRRTGIAFRGRVTWKLTLKPGRYTYRSDAHKSLRAGFTVTAAP